MDLCLFTSLQFIVKTSIVFLITPFIDLIYFQIFINFTTPFHYLLNRNHCFILHYPTEFIVYFY